MSEPKPTWSDEGVWAIVELTSSNPKHHKLIAGKVSRSDPFGLPMTRVDVPETTTQPAYTRFYTLAGPVMCITPVSEELARQIAEALKVWPVEPLIMGLVSQDDADV